MVGQQESYEPSADELIDVLKNLENLAAANPALYKSLVGQIKGNAVESHQSFSSNEQQVYYEQQQQQQQQQMESQYYQEESRMMETSSSQEYTSQQEFHQSSTQEYQQQEQHVYENGSVQQEELQRKEEVYVQEESREEVIQESEEERSRRLKMERLEKEANEEVRVALQKQREKKISQLQSAQPKIPKEITVIAGDGKAVKITLGVDKELDENSRKQVAEAAGLKHVPLPDFDGDHSDAAWAGSLKKTEKSKLRAAEREEEAGGSPWAGSLRHVTDNKNKKSKRKDSEEYGQAPWMGTLRHVVHDNKVTKNFGVNQYQSKRYPDEDATNPFEGCGGTQAKPAFPLTPAAIINGCAMTRDEMAKREDAEEVNRIRGNIQSSETVSSALLKALMPKLLKAHESKYPALDRDEATKIMEEILAMQVGLNVDQQAESQSLN